MLPNLRSLSKIRQMAATPQITTKRSQMKTDNTEAESLKIQVEHLQKQLESIQSNKSFVMKITNQQCTMCHKFRQQLEMQQKNEKTLKKQYEQRIEELQKQQNFLQRSTPFFKNEIKEDLKYQQLMEQLQKVNQYDLFLTAEPQDLIFSKNFVEEKYLKQIQELKQQIEIYEQQIITINNETRHLKEQLSQCKQQLINEKQQFDAFKFTHKTCSEQIYQLKLKLDYSAVKTSNSYHLPDDIVRLKSKIDNTIEKNMVHQLVLQNESLKEKIITQNTTIDRKAQENQIQRHLIKIETLEAELFLSLRCCRCHDLLSKPHTYIPCGHSCCEKCFKPSCQKCNNNSTEAVYRNIQFDELIKIFNIIKDTKTFIKGCLLQC